VLYDFFDILLEFLDNVQITMFLIIYEWR